MQTVLFVSPMKLGDEVAIRDLHERFPVEALDAGVGVSRLKAYIGSGNYALEITVDEHAGDFQARFHEFLGDADVRRFFDELRAYVPGIPRPDDTTADLPLSTEMLYWERPGDGVATSSPSS